MKQSFKLVQGVPDGQRDYEEFRTGPVHWLEAFLLILYSFLYLVYRCVNYHRSCTEEIRKGWCSKLTVS